MKKSSILGLVVIAIAIAVIIATYSKSSSYGSFGAAKKAKTDLQIIGHLDRQKPMYYDAHKDPNYFSFYVLDTDKMECKVILTKPKPEDFERSDKIVLTGHMEGDEFHASNVLLKCPSKYTQDKVETTATAKTTKI
ncbi:MAG TPA: cytochrome c maturation protein CcmE [Mucilaginibacter sp.]|jgi:cytochrome c-type biogenesis protein CcmE|nr:cytochrome c maturation protein CcmE [Mucilaginibacter sp.]